jgi:hypothetical protein
MGEEGGDCIEGENCDLVALPDWFESGGEGEAGRGGGGAGSSGPADEGGGGTSVDITTLQTQDIKVGESTINENTGPGGIGSVELGKIGEGGTLGKLTEMGVDFRTEVESHPSVELGNGDTVHPDFIVENSQVGFRGIIETKWGPLKYGNTRAFNQFMDNVEISRSKGLPVYYDLYSQPDQWWLDLFTKYHVRLL